MLKEAHCTIYSQLNKERRILQNKICNLEKWIHQLPEGELLCVKNGVYSKWILSKHGKQFYIPKTNHKLAEELAAKKYYKLRLKELQQELTIIEKLIKSSSNSKLQSSTLLEESSRYKSLLESHFQSHVNNPYFESLQHCCNDSHPENLIHKTFAGHYVRSKSEVIIANTLYSNHIPYRYEAKLQLTNLLLYPDFTICHPQTNEISYWEHFGMIDLPTYLDNSNNKLKLYTTHGIYPTINLITTYETQTHPIDSEMIQETIEHYFLR